jgi:hypothetical protein
MQAVRAPLPGHSVNEAFLGIDSEPSEQNEISKLR